MHHTVQPELVSRNKKKKKKKYNCISEIWFGKSAFVSNASSLLSPVPYSSMMAAKSPAISSLRGYGQGRQRPSYVLRMKKLFPDVLWQNSPSHWPQIHSTSNLSQSVQGEREGHVWLGPISIRPPGHCGRSLPLTLKRESSWGQVWGQSCGP